MAAARSSSNTHSDLFDAVVVGNGHYNLPAVPHIPGLDEYFKGQTLHSIAYDDPQQFAQSRRPLRRRPRQWFRSRARTLAS